MHNYADEINKGIELLELCHRLQSEKDGIDRPAPGVIDKTKTLDQFAKDISNSATNQAFRDWPGAGETGQNCHGNWRQLCRSGN